MRRVLATLAVGLVVCLAACSGGRGADAPAPVATSTTTATATGPGEEAPPTETPTMVRVGQPFIDTFTNGGGPELSAEVTVTRLDCGIKSVRAKPSSTDPLTTYRPAAGEEFCRAWCTIKNVGRRPLNWGESFDSVQLITDAGYIETQDEAYDAADALTQEGNHSRPDPRFAGSELNPGKTGYSTQVWSVPAGTKATGFEYRRYPYSPPVIIRA